MNTVTILDICMKINSVILITCERLVQRIGCPLVKLGSDSYVKWPVPRESVPYLLSQKHITNKPNTALLLEMAPTKECC